MGILGWIFLGLLAGAIAKAVMPGDDPGGCIGTTLIGVLGAVLGGLIASALGLGELRTFFDLETWLVAIGGALVLLAVIRVISGGRGRRERR